MIPIISQSKNNLPSGQILFYYDVFVSDFTFRGVLPVELLFYFLFNKDQKFTLGRVQITYLEYFTIQNKSFSLSHIYIL